MEQPTEDDGDSGVSPSVWRYSRASRAHVVIDAGAYFELMQDAPIGFWQRGQVRNLTCDTDGTAAWIWLGSKG